MAGVKFWIFFIVWCFLAFAVLTEIVYLSLGEDRVQKYLQLFKKEYKGKKNQSCCQNGYNPGEKNYFLLN